MQQAYKSPVLDTVQQSLSPCCPATISTETDIFNKWCVFVDPTDIDHKTKAANMAALHYYLDTKSPECETDLYKRLYSEFLDCDIRFINDNDMKKIPIEIFEKYNSIVVKYKNRLLLDYAEKHFLSYIENLEHTSRYLLLQSKTDPDIKSHKKLETRYHNSYCKKIEKRMKWLAFEYGNSSAVLLTLTLDPKKFGNDKLLMWQSIKPCFHEFMKKLRIHFKRHGRRFPKFIHAIEGQKNGNPHLHVVFLQSTRLTDWRRIIQYWGKGAIYINRTKEGEKVRHPINYVCKYITKTFANTNFNNIRTQSLVWLFNKKSFDRSKGLIVPLNPKSCGDWALNYLAIVNKECNRASELSFIYNRFDVLLDPAIWDHPPPICTGEHVIYADDEEVYSTDSLFWASFFGVDVE